MLFKNHYSIKNWADAKESYRTSGNLKSKTKINIKKPEDLSFKALTYCLLRREIDLKCCICVQPTNTVLLSYNAARALSKHHGMQSYRHRHKNSLGNINLKNKNKSSNRKKPLTMEKAESNHLTASSTWISNQQTRTVETDWQVYCL